VATESPLHQFTIERLIPIRVGGVDVSYTNSSLLMTIAAILITGFLVLAMRRASLVPGRLQSAAEMSYEFISTMIDGTVGVEGRRYFPFLFTLFMFILLGNMLGMIPWSFTFTSHIIVTFALAITIFLGVTGIGIARHGLHFFTLFTPHGVPLWLLPLMVPIELVSYCIRPFTLSIRLAANMLAGHSMLVIFAGFVSALGIFGIGPLAMEVFLILLELLVSFVQAYVFTILTCVYLRDAIHLH
jgi:F-type H+-transporting ATPase subunit a